MALGLSSPMRTISVRTIFAHKVRLLLTLLSVVLGTAFIAGSAMFTSSLSKSFDGIIATQFDSVDVAAMGRIPLEDISRLREDPAVESVEVSAQGANVIVAGPGNKVISSGGAPSQALALEPGATDVHNQGEVTEGHLPGAPGEVAINAQAAKKGGVQLGDELTIVTPTERITRTVVGEFEAKTSTGGWIGVLFPEDEYVRLFTDGQAVDTASITLKDRSEDNVEKQKTRLAQEFPGVKMESGAVLAEQYSKVIKQLLSFVNYFLWAFAGIALLVGTFIISNTFSMIVAQRNREFALLRSIGTSSAQVMRSVIFEAVLVGLVGSALGVVGGMGLVKALTGMLSLLGIGLPSQGLGLDTTSVLAPLVVGTLVTVVSAWAPAQRAGRIRPVQAMRAQGANGLEGLAGRTIIGVALLFIGAMAAVLAADSAGAVKPRAIGVGLAALLLVVGVWLAGPALSIPVVGALGRVAGKPFGAIGRLAATNSERNPRRTAATAFALTLGLVMVSTIGMLGASMRANLDEMLDSSVRSDFVLTGQQEMNISIPAGVEGRVRDLEQVDSTAAMALAPIKVNGVALVDSFGHPVSGVYSGDLARANEVQFTQGGFGDGEGVILSEDKAAQLGVRVGQDVTLTNKERTSTTVVEGIYSDNPLLSGGLIALPAAQEVAAPGEIRTNSIYVTGTKGVRPGQLREALVEAVADDLVVGVKDKEEFKGEQTKAINQMLGILYGLLGLAVIVAILGIVNTLALSVVERRQEIGMLRAVGVQRRQVRVMMYIESAVVAVFGALIGAVIGVSIGYAFVKVLSTQGLDQVVIPWSLVGGMLVASAFIGVLAAVVPGSRAAKTKPLEAIAD